MRRTTMSIFVGALAIVGIAMAHSASATPWLGVYSQEISSELREGMNYNGAGALVTRVVAGSPAQRNGIERGDVIVRVGGQNIGSPGDLVEAVGSASEAATVEVIIVRNGAKKALRVKLAERPEGDDVDDEPESMRVFLDHDGDGDNDHGILGQLPELLGGGMMSRARLGVRMESLNPDLAAYFGSREAKGALVLDVVEGSPAEAAGIRAGDVIQRVDGASVETAADLSEAVRSSDKSVSITLLRHGAKQTVKADLNDVPKVMRFRGGPQGMQWKSKGNNKSWDWQSPDGQRRVKRIVIDTDGESPGGLSADRESTEQLREELQQLREQLEQLREELKSNR